MHKTYNFEVAAHHNYIADGVRVHNTSILGFLSPGQLSQIVPDSLQDRDGDGSFDYVELDNGLGGISARGTTTYKMETVDGSWVAKVYVTHADERGRLVQSQFFQSDDGQVVEGSFRQIVLTGAEFGERVGDFITPYLTAAILSENASAFEVLALNTILGTFVENIFETVGGLVHDQLVSGGLQNGTLDDIASITFSDFGHDLAANAIDEASALLSQWVMAEVFESLDTDNFAEKFAYLLASEGVDYLIDTSIHSIVVDVLEMTPSEVEALGLASADLSQVLSGANLLNLLFKASIGTVFPSLESTEAQIASGLVTIGLKIFANIGGVLGSAIGYVTGLLLDLIFDEDPSAFTSVGVSLLAEELRVEGSTSHDGGDTSISNLMASEYVDFVNGFIKASQSHSNNLVELAQTMNLVFGYYEDEVRNGDGKNYDTVRDAVLSRIAETISLLDLNDGDVKFSVAIAHLTSMLSSESASTVLGDFSMRLQVAVDYQSYLENSEAYDQLIATSPDSAFSAGWIATFMLAREYGYTEDFTIMGDAVGGMHITSSGNDLVDAMSGDDRIHTYKGNDTVLAGDGDDSIFGGAGDDSLKGQGGDDVIFGGAGNDTLNGGFGIDEFYIGVGDSLVYGGGDQDIANFSGSIGSFQIVNFSDGKVVISGRESGYVGEFYNVEFFRFDDDVITFSPEYQNFVSGSAGDDLINGTSLRDALNGTGGDDTIYGFDGDDFLSGGVGDDHLFGGKGNDWIFGVLGNDYIASGSGDDVSYGGADSDFLWGDSGQDTLLGERGDDVLNGGGGDDLIEGGLGDDLLEAGDGNDTLIGGSGDDDLYGGDEQGSILGGHGDDSIVSGSQVDSIEAGYGDDIVRSGDGSDTVFAGEGDDLVFSGAGSDDVFGSWGDDLVYGGSGDDRIFAIATAEDYAPFDFVPANDESIAAKYFGEWGRDVAYGGAGNDQISLNGAGSIAFGGSGDDTVYIGMTQQRVDGGSGYDTVVTQFTESRDAVWYRSGSGSVGAMIFDTGDWDHQSENDYTLVLGVEAIRSKNGKELLQGYSYNNGYGNPTNYNPTYSGFVELSESEFDSIFSEEAFLERRFSSIHYSEIGGDDVLPEVDGWEQFGDGADVVNEDIFISGQKQYHDSGDQRVRLGGGDDVLDAGSGNDLIEGEAGADSLAGGSGADLLDGGSGDDTIYGGTGSDEINGGIGVDVIYGDAGDDTINGGSSADDIWGNAGHDLIFGNAGSDNIRGGSGRDTIEGESGDDELKGGGSPDSVFGGDGSDSLYGGDGGDLLSGEKGADLILGELGADKLLAGSGDDSLYGGDGKDELHGEFGDDTLRGDASSDNLYGGIGNDWLSGGDGNDDLVAGSGDDTLLGGAGADRLDGGSGNDTASYRWASAGVSLSLASGTGLAGEAEADIFLDIENVIGSYYGDSIWGDDDENIISGKDGDDKIFGHLGSDQLSGGEGDDTVEGDGGADVLTGEAGRDLIKGGSGDDALDGGVGNDRLFGGAGNDSLSGGEDSDQLYGGGGDDTLLAGDGADVVSGGGGSDLVFGGASNDLLSGGGADDIFYFTSGDGQDVILDFTNEDKIYIDGVMLRDVASLPPGVTGTETASGYALSYGSGDVVTLTGVTEAQFDEWAELEISGTRDGDLISGKGNADILSGADGSDTISGAAGQDTIYGDAGNDLLSGNQDDDSLDGGSGDDRLSGGDGADVFYFNPGDGADVILDFDAGSDRLVIDGVLVTDLTNLPSPITGTMVAEGYELGYGNGDTVLIAATADLVTAYPSIFGEPDQDISGTNEKDELIGGTGHDTIDGQGDDDTLYGDAGNDALLGDNGNDKLYGGIGNDTLTGGGADDIFYFTSGDGVDEITDFTSKDKIYVNGVMLRDVAGLPSGVTGAETASGYELSYGSGDVIKLVGVTEAQFDDWAELEIIGTSGDDLITGKGNSDVLFGAEGSDTIAGASGHDTLYGDAGDDLLTGGQDNDSLYGGSGDDTLDGGVGRDKLYGGTGNDHLSSSEGDNTFLGDAGNDTIAGGLGDDSIKGGSDDDRLSGGDGADVFYFTPGDGADVILDFDAGSDRLVIDGVLVTDLTNLPSPITGTMVAEGYELGYGNGDTILIAATADLVTAYPSIFGQPDQDISGTNEKDELIGGTGHDTIDGQGDDDTLYGGAGNDALLGDNGNDKLYGGTGNDTLTGGGADDIFYFTSGDGVDEITDFTSKDKIYINGVMLRDVAGLPSGVTGAETASGYELSYGSGDVIKLVGVTEAQFDDWAELEIIGTSGDDLITGKGNSDVLFGAEGSDTIAGASGHDTLYGDAGDDLLTGGQDNDSLYGGSGDDTLDGGVGRDKLYGGTGNDHLSSSEGDNTFLGDAGNDTIAGGLGDDSIKGGSDDDRLSGGDGADVFYFTPGDGADVILDFDAGSDRLVIDGVLVTDLTNLPSPITGTMVAEGYELGYGNGDTILIAATADLVTAYPSIFGQPDQDISGTNEKDELIGGTGHDTIDGQGDDDTLYGGAGNDALLGDNGNDKLYGGTGNDTLTGGGADDIFYFTIGDGVDEITDFTSKDKIYINGVMLRDVAGLPSGVTGAETASGYELSYGSGDVIKLVGVTEAQFDDWAELEIIGTSGDDLITGKGNSDVLFGAEGSDTIAGASGHDTLYGDAGDDLLTGGQDNDSLYGGSGDDTLDGGVGRDKLYGGTGNDHLSSSEGDNTFLGDAGNDTIAGGLGDDSIKGGSGDDCLSGGDGADVFYFTPGDGADVILDFDDFEDRIHFSSAGIAFEDLSLVDSAEGVVLSYSTSDTIFFEGLQSSDLGSDRFIFT